jgi:hypothetical protein
MAVVSGRMVDRSDARPDVHCIVEPLVMLAVEMVVVALITFGAMLGFVTLCDRV